MEAELLEALAVVRRRATALARPGAWAAEAEARQAEVARWRGVTRRADGLLTVLPLVAQQIPDARGSWTDEATGDGHRAGLDREGRPLVHLRGFDGYVLALWRHEIDVTEEIAYSGGTAHVSWVLHPGGELPRGAVGAAGARECWVERWIRDDDDRVARVERAEASEGGWAHTVVRVARHDEAGEVAAILRGHHRGERRDDDRLSADQVVPALEAALDAAVGVSAEHAAWDARTDRPERLREDSAGMAASLADGLAAAISAAAAASTRVPSPFVVDVRVSAATDDPAFPPWVKLGDAAWRDGARDHAADELAPVRELWRGVETGLVEELDLVPHCDPPTLQACRELSAGLAGAAQERGRAAVIVEELEEALAARLADDRLWPTAAAGFLPLVQITDAYADSDLSGTLARAERTAGTARVAAFRAALQPTGPLADGPLAPDLALRALTDRTALEALVRAAGLGDHAHRLAHEIAEVGLLARDTEPGEAPRSHLGGPPVLPAGHGWPHADGDRPLTFLAAIDLSELPPPDRGPAWPGTGWLLFFADLDHEGTGEGLIEPVGNDPGSPARAVFAPVVEPASPPGPDLVLTGRPVGWRPVLTLPDGYDAAEQAGIDVFERDAYEAVVDALRTALYPEDPEAGGAPEWPEEGDDWDEEATAEGDALGGPGSAHWIRGHATGAQGEAPVPGTVLLLQLSDDPALDFDFLDAGVIQFRIPADALERGDWSAVAAEPDSA